MPWRGSPQACTSKHLSALASPLWEGSPHPVRQLQEAPHSPAILVSPVPLPDLTMEQWKSEDPRILHHNLGFWKYGYQIDILFSGQSGSPPTLQQAQNTNHSTIATARMINSFCSSMPWPHLWSTTLYQFLQTHSFSASPSLPCSVDLSTSSSLCQSIGVLFTTTHFVALCFFRCCWPFYSSMWGSNLAPCKWKRRILATGLPGNSNSSLL